MNRRIEVMVRSQYNVPQDFTVTIGARQPSKIVGYDELPVTLAHAEKPRIVVASTMSTSMTSFTS